MDVKIIYRCDGIQKESFATENEDYALEIKKEPVETMKASGSLAVMAGERVAVTIHPKREMTILEATTTYPCPFSKTDQFFLNGYQSWTDTREYDFGEELHNMNQLPKRLIDQYHFKAYGDAWFQKYVRGEMHAFTFSYVRHADGRADFIGSYNEEHTYLITTYHKRDDTVVLESDCRGRTVSESFPLFDYVRLNGLPQDVLRTYFDAYGTCEAKPIRGYTSWYIHEQNIDEEKITAALDGVDSEQFDLFQIDDGYETYVGDWLDVDPEKFPRGLDEIVEKIHEKGLAAGIWLAPFVCETKSRVFREHPDWIYRRKGEPVFAGSNWSGDVVLDIRKEEVRGYIRDCLQHHLDAGFDFFKLDFLYAAALIRDRSQTRAEMMRFGMRFLREVLGDAMILGCGVPLSSAFSLVDYCRIGPDVSLEFDDVPYMQLMHRERISTKQTIQNTIYRNCMDGTVFRCDPDVFLLREESNKMTRQQRYALTLLNHLCGAVFMTSDDIANYDEEQRGILNEARTLAAAKVREIHKHKDEIYIIYEIDGRLQRFIYNRRKGELLHG